MSVSIASFKIVGLSPLLMNNPASMGSSGGATLDKKKIPSPEDEAAVKVYRNGDGNLYLPTIHFRSALLGACAGRRLGKTSAKRVIAGAVFIVNIETALVDPKTNKPIHDYSINTMRAVVMGRGVNRSRPEIGKWACNVDFEIDNDFIPDPSVVAELMNIAGKVCGVGDFRPQKNGPYGRFSAALVKNVIQKAA